MTTSQIVETRSQESGDPPGQESVDTDLDLTSLWLRKIFTLIFIHDKEHEQVRIERIHPLAMLSL